MNRHTKSNIANKVLDILENADNVVNLHISIFADVDEAPTIRYSIEEVIDTGTGEEL